MSTALYDKTVHAIALFIPYSAIFLTGENIDGFDATLAIPFNSVANTGGLRCCLSIFSLSYFSMKCISASVNISPVKKLCYTVYHESSHIGVRTKLCDKM